MNFIVLFMVTVTNNLESFIFNILLVNMFFPVISGFVPVASVTWSKSW